MLLVKTFVSIIQFVNGNKCYNFVLQPWHLKYSDSLLYLAHFGTDKTEIVYLGTQTTALRGNKNKTLSSGPKQNTNGSFSGRGYGLRTFQAATGGKALTELAR